jgi:hypothetical protein
LHQGNLRLLIGDDLLRQPTHLRILAIYQLCFGHVNGRLMMRKHQSDKINITVTGGLYRRHGLMHLPHT